jgi:protein-L-isoaspartate(D-aspartate) O-methyltransferase
MTVRTDPAVIYQLQQDLVELLIRRGVIHTQAVETAFRAVPRHLFLPGVDPARIYRDEVITTKHEGGEAISSSSQPAMMAIMLEQLDLRPGQRVLEIGAGSGYNAALMAQIVGPSGHVVTVDIDAEMTRHARDCLTQAGFSHVEVITGDGGQGHGPGAPYDRIILTVGAWEVLPAWHEQLAAHGRLVLPLSLYGTQKSIALLREGALLRSVSATDCGFMRMRGPFAGPERWIRLSDDGELGRRLSTHSKMIR